MQIPIEHVRYCLDVTFLGRYGSHPRKKNVGREIVMGEVLSSDGEGDSKIPVIFLPTEHPRASGNRGEKWRSSLQDTPDSSYLFLMIISQVQMQIVFEILIP